MIIWLNGTFGAGKTTTARLLVERDPGLRLFDPEWVGYLLRENLRDHPVADFRHWESWRRLTPVVADELARFTGQDLVAPQTVLEEEYWDELVAGLSASGHDVFQVLLEADEQRMRERIEADQEEPGAAGWRLDHLSRFAESRPWIARRADLVVNTTDLGPPEVAARIRAVVEDRIG